MAQTFIKQGFFGRPRSEKLPYYVYQETPYILGKRAENY